MELTRRDFLMLGAAALGGAVAVGLGVARRRPPQMDRAALARIPGRIVGQNYRLGHRLRVGQFPAPTREIRTRTVIAGGGMAGLSAAWALDRAGWSDFRLLELEDEIGGTSAWSQYPASACPWGAHYLPLPSPQSRAVVALLHELGCIVGWNPDGTPIYRESYLCQAPQERLFIHGTWQEGIFPHTGATRADLAERDAFRADMERWRRRVGTDGRPAFAIPIARSSRDAAIRALDRISMAEYLTRQGFKSARLRWYVEYGCRDDYGCTLDTTSAWAGIHYYASRGQWRNRPPLLPTHEADEMLTWPEGNGWIARQLRDRAGKRVTSNALVIRVVDDGDAVAVDYLDARDGKVTRVRADSAVVALPRFVAARVVAGHAPAPAFTYAPWVVSNLVVDRAPPEPAESGVPLSWDNVRFDSDSLGYVVATHQSLRAASGPTVLTHYQPLVGADPAALRGTALRQPWEHWRDAAVTDVAAAHPGFERTVQRADVMVWGHAMIRPLPGFMWGGAREAAGRARGRIRFAHTDMSGIAIFEEAQYHGVAAAEAIMREAGHRFEGLT